MLHWCLGLRGSGSTWIYNAVRKVALTLEADRPVVGAFVVRNADLSEFEDPGRPAVARVAIIKSHETDPEAAERLSRQAHAIWISIRDPRDSVTSLVRYHNLDFAVALAKVELNARFCARFSHHPTARMLRYEAGYIDEEATLDAIADSFGKPLAPVDRARIFAETRRPAIDAFIAQMETLSTVVRPRPNALVDLVTQWHDHHANRTGEIGRWREVLSLPEAAEVELRLNDWMQAFGYRREIAGGP